MLLQHKRVSLFWRRSCTPTTRNVSVQDVRSAWWKLWVQLAISCSLLGQTFWSASGKYGGAPPFTPPPFPTPRYHLLLFSFCMDKARLGIGIHRAGYLVIGELLPLSMGARHSHKVCRSCDFGLWASTLQCVWLSVSFDLCISKGKSDATPTRPLLAACVGRTSPIRSLCRWRIYWCNVRTSF